jgi:hypothetical protein
MKSKIYTLLLSGIFPLVFAQTGNVGINTSSPTATLDVNGNTKIRTTPLAATMNNHMILAVNQGSFEVVKMDPATIGTEGITNTTVFSARKTSGFGLASIAILPSGYEVINFVATDRTIGAATLLADSDHSYVVPSTGIYNLSFTFRYGSGLQTSLLSTPPNVAILRNRANTITVIDSKNFNGVNLAIANLTITEGTITNLYSFQAGDRISFGMNQTGLLNVGLLSSSFASINIHKVSN